MAAPGVTVRDDGTLFDRRGSLSIDDEGNATQCTTLIEDGILKGYMQDAMNARLMGVAPPATAGAKATPTSHAAHDQHLYARRRDSQEEIIASVKDGLYAVNFGGGQVDITSGKFVFSASEAWKIENGKPAYR